MCIRDSYRDDADWTRKPIAELRIPETVRDTILMRVERLDTAQAGILRCAAVLGRSFDYPTLIQLSEQDRLAVEAALQTAVQQQLLEEEPGSRHRYRFRHALTQEAIYEDLSAPTRERLHSAAADVLAEVPGTSKAEIALHLRNANRWQEAIQVTMDAAAAAEARLGYGEAAELYSLLLPLVTTGVDRARLQCRLGEARWLMGTPGRALEPLLDGVTQLEQAGEPLEAARHRLTLGRCYWERSDPAQARAEYELARQVLEPQGPSRDLALAYIRLAGLHVFNHEAAAAQVVAEKAIQTAASADAADMGIWAHNFLGLAIAFQGDYPAGIQHMEQSAQDAVDRGLNNIAGDALNNLVFLYRNNLEIGKLPTLAKRLNATKVERWATLSSRFAAMVWQHETGDLDAGLKTARELLAHARAMDDTNALRRGQLAVVLTCIELERFDEAREHLSRPSAESEVQDLAGEAWGWIHFHLATGDLAGALEGADLLLGLAHAEANDNGAEAAIETFVKAGRLDDANRVLTALEKGPAPINKLSADLSRAKIRLASGETSGSAGEVGDAVAAFHAAGLVLRELQGRLVLAEVYLHEGDAGAAEAEYRLVQETARELGLRLLERHAREGLAQMGIVVEASAAEARLDTQAPTETGERLVTVMFADVRGYTEMVGERPPAEMVDLVATYHRWAAAEVERNLGTVDKFAGDAVMATFNISGTQVDHAAHALQAALTLRDKAAMLGLPVGIGIATGGAVVGSLKTGANVSVVGETTNLASRLQSQAAAGEVVLSAETYRRLASTIDAAPRQLDLKGFAKRVTAYFVAAPGAAGRRPLGVDKPSPEDDIEEGLLSRREREVVAMVAAGLTNKQIAERLFIAERTAEGHVERIRNKLGVRSRTEVATWAVAHGIPRNL